MFPSMCQARDTSCLAESPIQFHKHPHTKTDSGLIKDFRTSGSIVGRHSEVSFWLRLTIYLMRSAIDNWTLNWNCNFRIECGVSIDYHLILTKKTSLVGVHLVVLYVQSCHSRCDYQRFYRQNYKERSARNRVTPFYFFAVLCYYTRQPMRSVATNRRAAGTLLCTFVLAYFQSE